jgi:flagellar hook-associated protein 2
VATLSSPGIGSGLDVQGIVSQLMAVERQPLTTLQTSTKRAQDQLSAYGKLGSAMGTLRDLARKLSDAPTWEATTVASSKPEAVTVSSDGSAPPGAYSIAVTQLAAAQTLRTNSTWTAPTESVGPGILTIEVGTWNAGATSFTAKPDTSARTVTIAPGSDSLEDVRDAINAAGAGVTASIINDASGSRLSLRSTDTGAENGFRITVNDSDGDDGDAAGLSMLAYVGSSSASQMTRALAAANATATINGIPVSSATNTLENVVDGLTLKLAQTTSAAVDVTVSRDTESIRKSVTDFATAYNDLVKLMRDQTRTATPGSDGNASTSGGVLGTDASAKGLLQQLRSLAGSSAGATEAFTRLADIGLEPQRDGTLKVNDNKLNAAVARLDDLQTFFARNDADDSLDGFGQMFKSFTTDRLADEGTVGARSAALQKRIDRDADQKLRLEARLALTEKRLLEQYGRMDSSVARLNSLQSYVSQQIAAWNRNS